MKLYKIKKSNIDKRGLYASKNIKEGISMLVFAVLLQLGFDEISSKETTGNLEIAFLNAIILVVFFISLMVFAGVGMFMTRKVENEKIKQKLQEIFIYECSMIFGFSVLLLLMNSFGIIDDSTGSGSALAPMLIFFMPIFHIFYLKYKNNDKFEEYFQALI